MRFRPVVLIVCFIFRPCAAVQRRVIGVHSRYRSDAHQDEAGPFGSLLTALGLGEAKDSADTSGPQLKAKHDKPHSDSLSGDEAAMKELKATVRAAASAAGKDESGEEWNGAKDENDGEQLVVDEEEQEEEDEEAEKNVETEAETETEIDLDARATADAEVEAEDAEEEETEQYQKEKVLAQAQGRHSDEEASASKDPGAASLRMLIAANNSLYSKTEGFNSTPSAGSRNTSFAARPGPRRPHRRHRAPHEPDSAPLTDSNPRPDLHPTPKPQVESVHRNLKSHSVRKVGHNQSQWPELNEGNECDSRTQECKRSMCRWLKLSSEDTPGKCTLFETQLRSCTYSLPENRPQGAPQQSLDCAINLLRRADVPAQDVGTNVAELVACIDNVPSKVNSTCYVALGLLRTEVHDWKEEMTLKKSVSSLQSKLKDASAQGRVALNTETKENEAIAELTRVLEAAEPLPGHYLVDEVREARGVLDRLSPIPAVRAELVEAAADAKHAFETTSLWRVQQAIVWLGVSVGKAGRYGLRGPAAKGKKALEDLKVLKQALLDLKQAKFQANVSLGTKSGVPESLYSLNVSIHEAHDAGLTNGMPTARGLLQKLQVLRDAVQSAGDAAAVGSEILAIGGNKGEKSLASAADALNASLVQAASLGLSDNSTVSDARDAYDRIIYILGVRHALQKAERGAQLVLARNGSVLSDDSEEAAIALLGPAVAWGTEVGLVNGLDAAQTTADMLRSVERAKENMTFALATGNASLEAKAGVAVAVGILESAISGSLAANTSAGVAAAQEQVVELRAILAARAALDQSLAVAERAMTSRSGYTEAGALLNASMHTADEVGLDKEAAIAKDQLRHLRAFARADRSLIQALSKKAPARRSPKSANIEDLVPNVTFHRFGLKVVDLPQVPNGKDDGDGDFDEHIEALADSIQEAKRRGEIDPQMEDMYENALGLKSAHILLNDAIATGKAAMNSKTNVEASVAELTTALREAHERELVLDSRKGSLLLAELQKIPPALEKIRGAMLAVNVSMRTQTGMDNALTDIMSAIELNRQLNLPKYVSEADHLRQSLLMLKQAYVQLKAAIMQGQISLQNEDGEEAAIAELNHAIGVAQGVGLRKLVEDAQELHEELQHMDTQHNNLQVAMNPSSDN